MVVSLIRDALAEKGWSVSEAATELGVERTFFSRLANGHRPPKTRGGKSPRQDERYRRIAEGLGIDREAFLTAVEQLQLDGPAARKAGASRSSLGDFVSRYAQSTHQPALLLLVAMIEESLQRNVEPFEVWRLFKALPHTRPSLTSPALHHAPGGAGMAGFQASVAAEQPTVLAQELERVGRALAAEQTVIAALLLELAQQNPRTLDAALKAVKRLSRRSSSQA
jgi:transcriptional regulator with XRE-family HTH domain